MKLKEKRGISLIVLVITVIVIIILAVAVILSISNNNPIENARKARFQSDLKTIQEEVTLYVGNEYANTNGAYKIENCTFSGETMKNQFSSITNDYIDKIEIVSGKVSIKEMTDTEINWAKEIGIGIVEKPWDNSQEYLFNIDTNSCLKNIKAEYTETAVAMAYNVYANEDKTEEITEIIIPEGVTSIADYAFQFFYNLKSIRIPNGVIAIGEAAFDGCSSLTSIEIPKGVMSIESGMFAGCSSLKNIEIPNTVTSIKTDAFNACTSLTTIKVGSEAVKSLVVASDSSLESKIVVDPSIN